MYRCFCGVAILVNNIDEGVVETSRLGYCVVLGFGIKQRTITTTITTTTTAVRGLRTKSSRSPRSSRTLVELDT